MNIALIIAGAVLIAVGVIRIVSEQRKEVASTVQTFNVAPKPTPEIRVVEREVVKYVEVPVSSPAASQSEPPAQSEPAACSTPPQLSAKEKGNSFEDYVANLFKDRNVFSVLEWNQGQTSSEGVYAENDKNPDFKIQQTLSDGFKLTYWVECKYRNHFDSADCIVIKNYQLSRYRKIQRESRRKILVAVGIGKEPNSPSQFYLIPLDSITGEEISKDDLRPFYMSTPATQFAPRTADWFQNQVFKKKRK